MARLPTATERASSMTAPCCHQTSCGPTALFGSHRGVWLGTSLDEEWVLALLTGLSTGALHHCYISCA